MFGERISHYHVLEQLGSGGMGVVYRARDETLDRDVALKFLPPELSRDSDARQRFMQEARAASALNHANVCTINEIGTTDDGRLFIVMPMYDGQTLKQRLQNEARHSEPSEGQSDVSTDEALSIARQIALGLKAAHEKGIVHRDIKPANIALTKEGRVVILDFGLAKLTGGVDLTKTGSTIGTVPYMSPEQVSGKSVDHRTDIWSLGTVMYQMLAGERPFTGDYEQAILYSIVNEDPASVIESRRDVGTDVADLVARCLDKEPDKRPTIDELIDGFDRKVVAPQPMPATANGASCGVSRPAFIAIAGLVALAVLLYSLAGKSFFEKDTRIKEKISIAVVDFVNETGEPELDGLSGMLITSLEQSRRLSVMTRSRLVDVFTQVLEWRRY